MNTLSRYFYVVIILLITTCWVHADEPPIYPGAKLVPQEGFATSMNPGMNSSDVIYHSLDPVFKVATWFQAKLKQEGVKKNGKVRFSLPISAELKKRMPNAIHTLTIEPRGVGSRIRLSCSRCY